MFAKEAELANLRKESAAAGERARVNQMYRTTKGVVCLLGTSIVWRRLMCSTIMFCRTSLTVLLGSTFKIPTTIEVSLKTIGALSLF